jgi:hypothetical protein
MTDESFRGVELPDGSLSATNKDGVINVRGSCDDCGMRWDQKNGLLAINGHDLVLCDDCLALRNKAWKEEQK